MHDSGLELFCGTGLPANLEPSSEQAKATTVAVSTDSPVFQPSKHGQNPELDAVIKKNGLLTEFFSQDSLEAITNDSQGQFKRILV